MNIAAPSHAAPTQGPASKSTRVEPAASTGEPVHFNLNFLPWRKESATRRSVESAVAQTARATGVETEAAPDPSASAYLPATGALPLRFASTRRWPDRLSPSEESALALALAPEPDLAILPAAALAQAQGAAATSAATGEVPSATGVAGGVVTISAASTSAAPPPVIVARPAYALGAEALLTADLVLHSLGNLSNQRGAVPAQFRPAVPAEASIEAIPLAVAP